MKKALYVAITLTVVLCACNRKAFVNKLTGQWKDGKYIYAGVDMTKTFQDTTNVGYTLTLNGDESYLEVWKSYSFRADSTILSDTLSYDSTLMIYHIKYDTVHFVDTTVAGWSTQGQWVLINSEEDLELRPNNDTGAVRMFNILTLTTKSLNLLNGNKEYDLSK